MVKCYVYNSKLESITYVLKKDNWIIGHMSIQLRPIKNLIHIFHVFLDRNNRNQGYGKMLIEKALAYANNHHIQKVTLAVHKNNLNAIGLYQSYGFETIGFNKIGSLKMKLELH